MKYLLALALMLYTQAAIPEHEWEGWQPWMLGAPCTLKIDFDEFGRCINVEVDEINWNKRK